jgi:hypothetical protein
MRELEAGECERCGAVGPGRPRWMFYRWHERFPESPAAKQFFCVRCLRVMRFYATIAGVIGVVAVGAIVYFTIVVSSYGSGP